MGKAPAATGKEARAKAGGIFFGRESKSRNRGTRIKGPPDQPRVEGGRLVGSFALCGSGYGTEASSLEELVGESFHNAEEVLHANQAEGAVKGTHLLNRNEPYA